MLQLMAEETGIIPPALQTRPTLDPVWTLAMWVYKELEVSRPPGFNGPTKLPFSEVALYASVHGFDMQETRELWRQVHIVDCLQYKLDTDATNSAKGTGVNQ